MKKGSNPLVTASVTSLSSEMTSVWQRGGGFNGNDHPGECTAWQDSVKLSLRLLGALTLSLLDLFHRTFSPRSPGELDEALTAEIRQ